ncbi:unnamed protein product [Rhodiola kirilowii]
MTTSSTANSSEMHTHPSDDPLFVSPSENVGVSLVTQPLTGAMDYIPWKRAMEMALGGKMKLEFVQGKIPKPTDDDYQKARWMKCNNVIHSWLINPVSKEISSSLIHSVDCMQAWSDLQMQFGSSNILTLANIHKEIAELTQGDMTVASYFGKLRKLWGDEESLDEEEICNLGFACKSTQTMMKRKVRNKIIKFLMGLNDVYIPVRTQILAMRPMPSLIEVYGNVITEESQRGFTKTVAPEISAMFSNQNHEQSQFNQNNRSSGGNQQNRVSKYGANRGKRPSCTHCHMQGHTKDTCYKIHGFPPGHRLHKGPQATQKSGSIVANNAMTNVTDTGNKSGNGNQLEAIQEQLK